MGLNLGQSEVIMGLKKGNYGSKIGNYGPPHVWSDKEANAFSGDGRKVALQINSREEGG